MVHNPQFREFVAGRYGVDPAHPFTGLPTLQPDVSPEADQTRSQTAYRLGAAAPNYMEGRSLLSPVGDYLSSLGNDTLRSLLLGASFGALGGAGYGLGAGRKFLRSTAMGATLGGAGSSVLSEAIHALRNWQASSKQASALDPLTAVRAALLADGSVDSGSKAELMRLLPQLNPAEADQLASLLRFGLGAGAGVLVARYLLKLGFVGTVLTALVGGYAASRFGGASSNAYGLPTSTQTDFAGRSRFIF